MKSHQEGTIDMFNTNGGWDCQILEAIIVLESISQMIAIHYILTIVPHN